MEHQADPRKLENDIARDRAALASTLDDLKDRMSVDQMARDALGLIRDNASAYTKSIDSAVRANPLALALTGAGLAWLIFGGRSSSADERRPVDLSHYDDPWREYEQSEDWHREADTLTERASTRLRGIEADARQHMADLRAGLTSRYNTARDFAAERAAVVADLAQDLARTMSEGLEGLSTTARERIINARERAYSARLRAQRVAKSGGRQATRAIEEHPLIAGAVALAAGAAVAAALPNTRREDRTFGDYSARLMDEAARLLADERDRVARAARGAGEEIREGVRETARDLSDKAAEIGERAKDRAQAEAASPQPSKSTQAKKSA